METIDALGGVLDALLCSFDREGESIFEAISGHAVASQIKKSIEKFDHEGFRFTVPYTCEKLMRGAVLQVFSEKMKNGEWDKTGRNKFEFLMQHADFVEHHIDHWISRIEGLPCHADKTRTIIRALLRHFATGEKIHFNYGGEYTFHLPKAALNEHEKILVAFDAIYALYYGHPEKYLSWIADMATIHRDIKNTDIGAKN